MATILNFPIIDKSKRARVESIINYALDKAGNWHGEAKDEMRQALMSSYDKHTNIDITTGVKEPPDRPFSDDQVTVIKEGMKDLENKFADIFDDMLMEIFSQKIRIYMLTGGFE